MSRLFHAAKSRSVTPSIGLPGDEVGTDGLKKTRETGAARDQLDHDSLRNGATGPAGEFPAPTAMGDVRTEPPEPARPAARRAGFSPRQRAGIEGRRADAGNRSKDGIRQRRRRPRLRCPEPRRQPDVADVRPLMFRPERDRREPGVPPRESVLIPRDPLMTGRRRPRPADALFLAPLPCGSC